MTNRSGRSLASGPLLAILVAVLITADFFLILERRMPTTLIHTLIVGFFIVAAVKLLIDHARKTAVAEVITHMTATAASIDARRCCCTEATEPLRVVGNSVVRGTAAVRPTLAAPADLPPDNVLSFELGRQVGRETRD